MRRRADFGSACAGAIRHTPNPTVDPRPTGKGEKQ